jgi:hypothetical protein
MSGHFLICGGGCWEAGRGLLKAGALDEARNFLDDDDGPEKTKLCGELS